MGYLPRLLTTHLWSETKVASDQILFYRPLFSIWMLLVNTVGGLSPWAWHLSNIVLACCRDVSSVCCLPTAAEE